MKITHKTWTPNLDPQSGPQSGPPYGPHYGPLAMAWIHSKVRTWTFELIFKINNLLIIDYWIRDIWTTRGFMSFYVLCLRPTLPVRLFQSANTGHARWSLQTAVKSSSALSYSKTCLKRTCSKADTCLKRTKDFAPKYQSTGQSLINITCLRRTRV